MAKPIERDSRGRWLPGQSANSTTQWGPENPPPKSPGRPRRDAWVEDLQERLSDPRIRQALADRLILSVSGNFIYSGLRSFNGLRTLLEPESVFEVLYSLSVGIERLLKVCVVLLEHGSDCDDAEFEKSLITHNHVELLRRIRAVEDLPIGKPHNRLLSLLAEFYKSARYDRFMSGSDWEPGREKRSLHALFEANLDLSWDEDQFFAEPIPEKAKRHLARLVEKIAHAVFAIIRKRASELNIYTYELRSGSKAERIFLGSCDLADESEAQMELLLFLMNAEHTSGLLKFMGSLEPLHFEEADFHDYWRQLTGSGPVECAYALDDLHDDPAAKVNRSTALRAISSESVSWNEGDECEEEEWGDDAGKEEQPGD